MILTGSIWDWWRPKWGHQYSTDPLHLNKMHNLKTHALSSLDILDVISGWSSRLTGIVDCDSIDRLHIGVVLPGGSDCTLSRYEATLYSWRSKRTMVKVAASMSPWRLFRTAWCRVLWGRPSAVVSDHQKETSKGRAELKQFTQAHIWVFLSLWWSLMKQASWHDTLRPSSMMQWKECHARKIVLSD